MKKYSQQAIPQKKVTIKVKSTRKSSLKQKQRKQHMNKAVET